MTKRSAVRRKTAGRRAENGHTELPAAKQVLDTSKTHFADMQDDLPWQGDKPENSVETKVEKKIEEQAQQASPEVDEDFIKQQMDRPGFTLSPGDGWLFYQLGRENMFIWQGHMNVPPYGEILAVAKLDITKGEYEITLRHGKAKNFAKITEFIMPQMKGQPYVDGEVKIPLPEPVEAAGLRVTERKYQVRAFKDERPTRKNILRIQLPKVREGQRGGDVPM